MQFDLSCPSCRRTIAADPISLGYEPRCPWCRSPLAVPPPPADPHAAGRGCLAAALVVAILAAALVA